MIFKCSCFFLENFVKHKPFISEECTYLYLFVKSDWFAQPNSTWWISLMVDRTKSANVENQFTFFFSFSPQGIGSFESQTGIYIGEWKRGLQNGNGTAIYNNGNRYIGQFKDGFKSGYGKFQVNTIGDVYEGEFRNGLRNGQVSGSYLWCL